MDILSATTNARPQYGVIIYPEGGFVLPVKSHTELEIGFGNGEFTVQYAKNHPEIFLYGIEISQSCVLRCARRAYGLENLRIINTDARYMLKELFDDESLNKIIMQFPCPWSGSSNAHRRVTAKSFADGLAAVLKIGGIFEFISDDSEYSQEVKNVLGSHEVLNNISFEINPAREITTKYERKWLEEGKNIYRLEFMKTKAFTTIRQVNSQEMHVKINKLITSQDIEKLRNITGKDSEKKSFWKFGRNFIDSNNTSWLVETLTSDDEFEQKFYMNISHKEGGFSLVRLDKTADAFLTPAVRAAITDAANILQS